MISDSCNCLIKQMFYCCLNGNYMFSKRDLMNLESVIMLSSVDENSGKKKASLALNTSVDTINKYIDNLEAELGVKLLSSNEKGSSLTLNGQKIIGFASKIKECLSDIYKVVSIDGDVRGEVRIARDKNISSRFQSKSFFKLSESYPNLKIICDLVEGIPDMNSMLYDMALSYGVPNCNDIVVIASKRQRFGFYASDTYLLKYGRPQDFDDLLQKHRLVLDNQLCQRIKGGKDILRKANQIAYVSNSCIDAYEVIRNGEGIGIMPIDFIDNQVNFLENIPCESISDIYLIAHRSTKDIPKVRVVLDYYKELISNL